MAHRGFTTPAAGHDQQGTEAAWSKFNGWTGSAPLISTTGAYGNKFSMFCQNSCGLRSDGFVDAMPDNAWGWVTADLYLDTMEVESTWLILSSGHFVSTSNGLLGIQIERDTSGAGSGLKFHLCKFNFDAFGAPENYTQLSDNGDFGYAAAGRIRIQVRQYYNSGDDNMDVEVWINQPGAPNSDNWTTNDITKVGGRTWAQAADSQWATSQFEETAGKGGANFDAYWGNFIWNDELAGVGPSAQPDDDYVVVAYQFRADTDDAARDDFTPDNGAKKKYRHGDDDHAVVEDTFIYVQQSTTDEQELKCDELVEKGGGTKQVDAIYVTAQALDSDAALRAAWLEAAIHCTGGAAWSPTIFDSLFAIFRRKTLSAGKDLRIYQAFVVVLGKDIENSPDNPDSNDADATPAGQVSSFVNHWGATIGLDASFFVADFDAPPAAPAVGARRRWHGGPY